LIDRHYGVPSQRRFRIGHKVAKSENGCSPLSPQRRQQASYGCLHPADSDGIAVVIPPFPQALTELS
jgi:hypothetical protein